MSTVWHALLVGAGPAARRPCRRPRRRPGAAAACRTGHAARRADAGGGRALSPELVPAFLPQPQGGLRGGQGFGQALRGGVRAARLPLLRQDAHRGAGAEVHQRLRARELHGPAAGPVGRARGHRLRRHRAARAGAGRALGRDLHPHRRILQGRPDGPRGQVGARAGGHRAAAAELRPRYLLRPVRLGAAEALRARPQFPALPHRPHRRARGAEGGCRDKTEKRHRIRLRQSFRAMLYQGVAA